MGKIIVRAVVLLKLSNRRVSSDSMRPLRIAARLVALGFALAALPGRVGAATVLMVSIDGLKPEYVTDR